MRIGSRAFRAALVMNEFLAPRWSSFRDARGQLAGITLLRSHGMHVQVMTRGVLNLCQPDTCSERTTQRGNACGNTQCACTQTYWIWLGVGWCVVGWAVFSLGTWVFHLYLNRAFRRSHLPRCMSVVHSQTLSRCI